MSSKKQIRSRAGWQNKAVNRSRSRTALILTGGGARGAYQAGALAAVAEKLGSGDGFPILYGVSAGAINAAYLASSEEQSLRETTLRLWRSWSDLTLESVFRTEPRYLAASAARWALAMMAGSETLGLRLRGIVNTEPLQRFLSSRMDLGGIRRNLERGGLQALALSTTSYSTGETVTFVQARGAIEEWIRHGRLARLGPISISHVMASAALPFIFPAIQIGDRFYGDGAIRQSAPLSPAIHLGASHLLAISVRYPRTAAEAAEIQVPGYPPPAQIAGLLMNSIFLDALEVDAERVESVNQLLQRCGPAPIEGFRPVRLLVLRPSRDLGKLAAGFSAQLPWFLRWVSRGLGAEQSRSPDFLSYLLFHPSFVNLVAELGYEDTLNRWSEIEPFLEEGGF